MSILKTKQSRQQRRHHMARFRWWLTLLFFAFVGLFVDFAWEIITISLTNHIAWASFPLFRSTAISFIILALVCLLVGWMAVNSWHIWQEVRREDQTSQAIQEEGVWPPPPRRD